MIKRLKKHRYPVVDKHFLPAAGRLQGTSGLQPARWPKHRYRHYWLRQWYSLGHTCDQNLWPDRADRKTTPATKHRLTRPVVSPIRKHRFRELGLLADVHQYHLVGYTSCHDVGDDQHAIRLQRY